MTSKVQLAVHLLLLNFVHAAVVPLDLAAKIDETARFEVGKFWGKVRQLFLLSFVHIIAVRAAG